MRSNKKIKNVKLNDICELITKGTTPLSFESIGINFIRIENINGLSLDNDFSIFISSKTHSNELKRSQLKEKDILFAIAGATIGKCAVVSSECLPANTNQALSIIRLNENNNPFYIANILSSTKMKKYIYLNISVGAQPNLSLEQIGNFELSIPDLEEQNKIATFLNLYYKKIELQKQKIDCLRKLKKTYISKCLSFKANNTIYNIQDIFNITRGLVVPKSNLLEKQTLEYCYPTYSSQTSNEGILGYSNTYLFDSDCLTWTTDGANAGKVFKRTGKFNCTNVCGVLIEKDEFKGFANYFVSEVLNCSTPKYVSYVGNPKLMNNVMGNIKISLPDLDTQLYFSKVIDAINRILLLETQKLQLIEKYKQGLLQQLFI